MSVLEDALLVDIIKAGLPSPVREFRFAKVVKREWRLDFAWPDLFLGVEVEGGTWISGRHTRGSGFEGDCRKYNTAAKLGYLVLRFSSGMIASGEAIAVIEEVHEMLS